MKKTMNHNTMRLSLLAFCTFLLFGCGLFNISNHDPAPDAVAIHDLDEGDDFASELTRQEKKSPSLRTFTIFSQKLGNIEFTLLSNPNMEILGEKMFLMGVAQIGEDQVSAFMTVNELGFVLEFSYKDESYSIQSKENLDQVFANNTTPNGSRFLAKAGSTAPVDKNQIIFEKGDRYSIYTNKPEEEDGKISSHDALIPLLDNRSGLHKTSIPEEYENGFGGFKNDTIVFEIFDLHPDYSPFVENLARVFRSISALYAEQTLECLEQQLTTQGPYDKCTFLDDIPHFTVAYYEPPNSSPLLFTPYENFSIPNVYPVTAQEDYENTIEEAYNASNRGAREFLRKMNCYLQRHPRPFQIEKNRIKMWLTKLGPHSIWRQVYGMAYTGTHQRLFYSGSECWKINGNWSLLNGNSYSDNARSVGGLLVAGTGSRITLTHEVGHIFGASHVGNDGDVMKSGGNQLIHKNESNIEAMKYSIEGVDIEEINSENLFFQQIGARSFYDDTRMPNIFRNEVPEGWESAFPSNEVAGFRLRKLSTSSSRALQFTEVNWIGGVQAGEPMKYLKSLLTVSSPFYNNGFDGSVSAHWRDRYISNDVPVGDTISYQVLSPIPLSQLKEIVGTETLINVYLKMDSQYQKANRFNGTFVETLNYKGEVLGTSPVFDIATQSTQMVQYVFDLEGNFKRITKFDQTPSPVSGFRLERELQSNDPNERYLQFSEVSWLDGNGGDRLADVIPTGTPAFTGYNKGNNGNRISSHQSNRYLSQSRPKGSTVHYQLLSPDHIHYGTNNIIIQVDLNVHVLNKKGGRFNGTLVQLLDLNGEPFGTPSPKFNQVNDNTIAVQYIFDPDGNYIETNQIQAN